MAGRLIVLGDPTAKMLGRLTLNPLKHIDMIGTIIVPIILITFSGFVFGWAKPVPVTTRRLNHPKRDMVLVAIAGPLANAVMAILWGGVAKIGWMFDPLHHSASMFTVLSGHAGIIVNLILMVLNLIPIPPLDGSKILYYFMPTRWSVTLYRYEGYGLLIIIFLLATGILGAIIQPIVASLIDAVRTLYHV